MSNFDLTNYLSKNKLTEAIELTRLYPKDPDEVAQKVADHFTKTDNLNLIYSIKPGSLKMTPQGAYFDLNTKAGPDTPGEDFKDENGFDIENYLGDYAGGSFVIKSEEGLDEDFFVIRNMANRNAKVGMVNPEGEETFTTETEMNEMEDLKLNNPKMETEKIIETYNIGKDSRLVFAGDTKTYYVKNISPDKESVFVTIDGSTTFKKPLSKITKVDGKMVEEMKSNKMTKEELKEMIRQNILNELATDIKEDTDIEFGNSDGKLAPLYADFYEGLEEAEEEVEDIEKVDVNIDEPAAAEPTLTDTEKEIQGHLNQALYAAQEMGNESTTEDKEKLIQQIGNTIKFFTSDFVVKEAEGDLVKNIGKGLEYEATEEMIRYYAQHLMDEGSYDVEELAQSYLDMPRSFPRQLDYTFFKNNYDDILSVAMTGLGEGKKEYYVKEDVEQSDVESAITGKKLDLKKLEDATKKAMSGDSTDLTMFLAGVFEGKKEYYKDAEADDAEHIDALEKDMKDDKRSSMNEDMFPLFKKIIK